MVLIDGYYHCANCDREVAHVQREHGFWLCDECWEHIVPPEIRRGDDPDFRIKTPAQIAAMERYWEWYGDMVKRHRPYHDDFARTRRYLSWRPTSVALDDDSLIPVCACGEMREPLRFTTMPGGLFGGPFAKYCPRCEARRSVETLAEMAANIHPEWDDEDWLEALWASHWRAFDLGILPDYWFQLRHEHT